MELVIEKYVGDVKLFTALVFSISNYWQTAAKVILKFVDKDQLPFIRNRVRNQSLLANGF